MVEIKIWHHFEYKKPFVTPNFCGRNFSTMHHFWVWIFLSPKIDEYLVQKTENAPKWCFQKRWLKINPRVILRLLLDSFWHQKRSWFIIAQTRAKSSDLEYFCCFVKNTTCGTFFPISFCQKIQILYQNLKILGILDFWNSLYY